MRTIDFTPLYRSIVGFDRLADLMDSATKVEPQGYPPYNIQHVSEDEYLIELAVAGFGDDDLSVEVQQNVLTVIGRLTDKSADDAPQFLHRGIAERAFERRFHLADHVEVSGADLSNGMLSIRLVREMPEAAKPRQISIGNGETKSGKSGRLSKLVGAGSHQAA
jgi:molecular chaperone IbpA